MTIKAINILDYKKIIGKLSQEAGSELTKQLISELMPLTDPDDIQEGLDETGEAVELITHKGPLPLGNFYDIKGLLDFSRKGGTLTMADLLKVRYNLTIARNVVNFLKKDVPPMPIILAAGEVLEVFENLEKEIDRCIITEDEMADNASPELRSIRRKIVTQNEALKSRIDHIINSPAYRNYLQDAIVTMRDGRYVVPVKAEHRSHIPGIVHDQSSSGATLFVEPQGVVDLNNQLRQLEIEEQAEIARILKDLSERVSEHYHGIVNNQDLLKRLDFINAKGKFALSMRAEKPVISYEGILNLKEARHPLIDPKKVVPVNVAIGGDYRELIVTGPNTGGKTVTLKTCGLLSLMAQTGLHIPAAEGSSFPIFTDVFADIGDEQSIEQSLSTFSSHMKTIVEIVAEAGPGTLVLMDELGAGTDPTEGAALAISILEELYNKGATVLATTHYTELKKYALTKEGVRNASMQFDVETLSPTYKLVMGVPGKSNAFEISKKLGLDGAIIDKARTLLEGGDIAFEEVLTAIEEDKKAAEQERDEATLLNIQMKKLKDQLEAEKKKNAEEAERIINEAKAKAREIMNDVKQVSKEVQEELKELAKLESLGERNKRLDNSKRKIKDAAGRYKEQHTQEINNNPVNVDDLMVGDRVKIVSMRQNGEVIALPNKKGELTIQVGLMKVRVMPEDLMIIPDGRTKRKVVTDTAKNRSKYASMYRAKAQTISTSVDVKGMNLEEAIDTVSKYIDDCFMAGLTECTIVHGRGEGILMKGIRNELKKHPHVISYHRGEYNEGGDGVTVCVLKK